jgi:hypothetical protein
MNRWASPPLGTSASDFLVALRSETPVALVATPRAEFRCERVTRWRAIESDAGLTDFDQVPLTTADGEIEAVFVRGKGVVRLREAMFMASNAPLISFLESADQQRFRFLLEEHKVSGMVTLSDVQKLPVYSVLFGLLIAIEILLMDWIRKTLGADRDAWLCQLNVGQRSSIDKHWKRATKSNIAIDRLSCASFGQEIRAASGLGLFKGDDGRQQSFKALRTLRNQICHAMEFALTPEQALTIPALVRDAEAVATWLQERIGDAQRGGS